MTIRIAAIVPALLIFSSGMAAELPRYQLPAGRVLTYAAESSKGQGTQQDTSSARYLLTVLDQNADGSARVLVRTNRRRTGNAKDVSESASSAIVKVYPDGRIEFDMTQMLEIKPEVLFPRLPADEKQLSSSWQGDLQWTGSRETYTPGETTPREFVFSGVSDGPTERIHAVNPKWNFRFDTQKGIISKVQGGFSKNDDSNEKARSFFELESENSITPAEAGELARNYDIYFDALREYRAVLRTIHENPSNAAKLINDAKTVLAVAAKKIQDAEVAKAMATKIAEHDQSVGDYLDGARHLHEVLNKPVGEWSANDLDGGIYSSKDLRGQIVVMDFWYRGCGWCIYSMPQIKQLAADYKGKGVVVLGMNTDKVVDDARFVVKELGIDYPQIRATNLVKQFKVEGFPSVILIDSNGNLRDLHLGYAPDLRETLSRRIDALLSESSKRTH